MKLITSNEVPSINSPEITELIVAGILKGTPHLPTVNFNTKTITNDIPGIIFPNFSFEQNLYRINKIYGGFFSNDYSKKQATIPCSIGYSIKLPCPISAEMMLNSWYSPTMRKTCEAFIQFAQPKTMVFIGASGFGKEIIAAMQCIPKGKKSKVHVFSDFLFPLRYPHKNDSSFTDDLNFFKFKYLRLNTTIANLNQFAKTHDINLHSANIYESLSYIKWNGIIPDYLYIKKFIGLDLGMATREAEIISILNSFLEINPKMIIVLSLYSADNEKRNALKDIIFKNYKIIFIPKLSKDNIISHISPKYPANRCYVITYADYSGHIFKSPKSNFAAFPIITDVISKNMKIHKFRMQKIMDYDINGNREEKELPVINFDYRKLKNIFFETYEKYYRDLELLNSVIKNDYIMGIRLMNMIQIGLLWYPLESSINIPECIFIHKLLESYFNDHEGEKCTIIEIGCAYGMSGMIIANCCSKSNKGIKFKFISIDPNQKTEWHGVGIHNIKTVINNNKNISYKLDEGFSTNLINYSDENVDIIFIDGSHDFMVVLHDINTADKILRLHGIIILDDVLHEGVKQALELFFKGDTGKKYTKIYFDDKNKLSSADFLNYKIDNDKKSYKNPKTMSAFMRIT